MANFNGESVTLSKACETEPDRNFQAFEAIEKRLQECMQDNQRQRASQTELQSVTLSKACQTEPDRNFEAFKALEKRLQEWMRANQRQRAR